MAVAADLHRNFLIPEHRFAPDNGYKIHPMICVYSFVGEIITHISDNFNKKRCRKKNGTLNKIKNI